MKSVLIHFVLLSTLTLIFQTAMGLASENHPELVNMPPSNVFAPPGFDDNDNAQIVLHGQFSSSCYKVGKASFYVDHGRREIKVQNLAYRYAGTACLDIVVPWTVTLDLGTLRAGGYRVVVKQESGVYAAMASLPVTPSLSPNPDNLQYANVEGATFVRGKPLRLNGTYSMDCLYVREVKVLSRTPDVIEVLPVVDRRIGKPCAHVFIPLPFEVSVNLPAVSSGLALVHVRSMSGQSVNIVARF